MNREQQTVVSCGYGFPSSPVAEQLGFGRTGCYYLHTRGEDIKTFSPTTDKTSLLPALAKELNKPGAVWSQYCIFRPRAGC